jgi:predicted ATPase
VLVDTVSILPDNYPVQEQFPFNLEIFKKHQTLVFNNPVTFFIGENGTGKSTLLRAIANKCNIHIWEHSERTQVRYNPYANELYNYIDITFTNGQPVGSFFGSEIFRHFAEQLDEWAKMDPAIMNYFGGQSLTTKSHGQCNMAFFESRFARHGLYLLDEPESALSPKSLIEFMKILTRSVQSANAQFIIATHSPLLLALNNSTIFSFDQLPITQVSYKETEYYKLYKKFFEDTSVDAEV